MPPVPSGHSGAVTTGQPANEMGCVSKPMAARQGCCVPLRSSHSVPISGALTGEEQIAVHGIAALKAALMGIGVE